MAYRIVTNSETYFGVLLHKHAPNYVRHIVWCKVSIRLSHDTRIKYIKKLSFLPYTDKMFVNYIDRLAEVMTHIEAIRNTAT